MSDTNGNGKHAEKLEIPPQYLTGDGGRPLTANECELVYNIVSRRLDFWKRFSDPRRDLDTETGMPDVRGLDAKYFREMYDSFGIAARVVEVLPRETFKRPPTVYESEDAGAVTPFEKAWDELGRSLRGESWNKDEKGNQVWEALRRLDIMSGIGHYGVMLLGIDDGLPLDQPVQGLDANGLRTGKSKERKLLYLRSFDESLAQITQYEDDERNPRFGQPKMYAITFNDPGAQYGTATGVKIATRNVHWSRVLHLADNRTTSEVLGAPRQRSVIKHILSLLKIYLGSGEGFWRGCFPGLAFETHPQLAGDAMINIPELQAAADRFMNSSQKYIITEGVHANTIAPTVVDPTSQIEIQLTAICIRIPVPKRIFMGSERGELSSAQDDETWNEQLIDRQNYHATPNIVTPFVDRCIAIGVLPEPKQWHCWWPDLKTMGEKEKADVALVKTQALAAYIAGGCDVALPPLDFYTRFMEMEDEEAKEIIDSALEHLKEVAPDGEEPVPGREPAEATDPLDEEQKAADIEATRAKAQADKQKAKFPPRPSLNELAKVALQNGGQLTWEVTGADDPGHWIITPTEPTDNAKKSSGTNCGTGAGGFKAGNKCAVGKGSPVATSVGGAAETLASLEPELVNLSKERGVFISKEGKVIADKSGSREKVVFDDEAPWVPEVAGGVFTHSHGASHLAFSRDDITSGAAFGVAEIRAVSPEGVHVLTPSSGVWPKESKVKKRFSKPVMFEDEQKHELGKKLYQASKTLSADAYARYADQQSNESFMRAYADLGLQYAFYPHSKSTQNAEQDFDWVYNASTGHWSKQPRVPAGHPAGGQFTSGGASAHLTVQVDGDVDPQIAEFAKAALNEELADLSSRYPGLARILEVTPVNLRVVGRGAALEAGTAGKYSFDAKTIHIAPEITGDLGDDVKLGGFTVGGNSLMPTYRHELGHHVSRWMEDDAQEEAWARIHRKPGWKDDVALRVSKYATTNAGELFSEAFAAYTHKTYQRGSLPREVETVLDSILLGPTGNAEACPRCGEVHDPYWEATLNAGGPNCGTGKGGFQKGNKCALGGKRGIRAFQERPVAIQPPPVPTPQQGAKKGRKKKPPPTLEEQAIKKAQRNAKARERREEKKRQEEQRKKEENERKNREWDERIKQKQEELKRKAEEERTRAKTPAEIDEDASLGLAKGMATNKYMQQNVESMRNTMQRHDPELESMRQSLLSPKLDKLRGEAADAKVQAAAALAERDKHLNTFSMLSGEKSTEYAKQHLVPAREKYQTLRDEANRKSDLLRSAAHAELAQELDRQGIGKVSLDLVKRTIEPGRAKETYEQAKPFLEKITGDKHNDLGFSVRNIPADKPQRANCESLAAGRSIIYMDNRSGTDVFIHEFGHSIETKGQALDLATAFLAHRTKGEGYVALRKQFPGAGFEIGEVGSEDEFGRLFEAGSHSGHYVGKYYRGRATEITSMGIQLLYNDPIGFAEKDPEYFKFTVGIVSGKLLE